MHIKIFPNYKENILGNFFLLLLVTLIFSCSTIHKNKLSIKKANDNLVRAWNNQDTISFTNFFSDSFNAYIGNTLKIRRDEYIILMKHEAQNIYPPIRMSIKFSNLKIKGDSASSLMKENNSYKVKDISGKMHLYRYRQIFYNIWIRTYSYWKILSTYYEAPSRELWLDGKPISRQELSKILGNKKGSK